MCLSPVPINLEYRSRYYYKGIPQLCNISVPCGVCGECVSSSQNDYFIRMHSEFQYTLESGGKVAFLTFTFSDDNVPCYTYRLKDNGIVFDKIHYRSRRFYYNWIFGFNKKLFQSFNKKYRKYLNRCGIDMPYRYIVVGEYGSNSDYSQRPHYHALLYLKPQTVSHYSHNGYFDENEFLSDISRYWHYGIVSKSKTHGLFIENDSAIRYVSKYISKSMLLTKNRQFNKFYEFISYNHSLLNHPDDIDNHFCVSDYELHNNKYRVKGSKGYIKVTTENYESLNKKRSVDSLFKYYLKQSGSNLFTLKSKNFGEFALSGISLLLSVGNKKSAFELFDKGYPYIEDSSVKYHSFSSYYYRKLFYNCREDGTYYLNEDGYKFKEYCCFKLFDDYKTKLNYIKDSLFSEYGLVVDDLLLNKLACYKLFVKGYSFNLNQNGYILKSLDASNDNNLDVSRFILTVNKFKYNYIVYFDGNDTIHGIDVLRDNVPCFGKYRKSHGFQFCEPVNIDYYNHLIESAEKLMIRQRILDYSKKNRDFEFSKYLRDIFNDTIYNN